MKVEQSIQCVSKSPGRHYCVGQTGNAAAVAEFELLYHDVGSIASLSSVITADGTSRHLESKLQSCFNKTCRNISNENACKMLDFVLARQNMYHITAVSPIPLHSILNYQKVDPIIYMRVLNCLNEGRDAYKEHRQEVYVKKKKSCMQP